jgi:hypothetical protein
VNVDHVGVRDASGGARFCHDPRARIGLLSRPRVEQLHRHALAHDQVFRLVNRAGATAAELAHDRVFPVEDSGLRLRERGGHHH